MRDFGLYTKRVCTNVAFCTPVVRLYQGAAHEKSQHGGWLFEESDKLECLFGFHSFVVLS